MSHCNILEMKLGNDKWDMKVKIKVEMVHNRNKTSYNCNIKEMRTKFQLRESGKYKRGR